MQHAEWARACLFAGTEVHVEDVEYPVVELRFGQGDGRVPSVRLCVVDREVGLLGRDLLDLVVLELDGPNQRWTMSR